MIIVRKYKFYLFKINRLQEFKYTVFDRTNKFSNNCCNIQIFLNTYLIDVRVTFHKMSIDQPFNQNYGKSVSIIKTKLKSIA